MATKYWQLRLKGERAADEVQSAIGQSGGMLLRVHVEGGETRVYFAVEESVVADMSKALKAVGKPKEVHADEVSRLD